MTQTQLFWLFCGLNVVNVIIQTVKSIATIKCNKYIASLVNAVAYGLYAVVLVYMTCDLKLWVKVAVISLANLIGVFVVKVIEEKLEKEKLWKIEATVALSKENILRELLDADILSYSTVQVTSARGNQPYVVFNIYAPSKNDTRAVHKALDVVNAKYCILESK